MISNPKLLILDWPGFCQRIVPILAQDLQEHCKSNSLELLQHQVVAKGTTKIWCGKILQDIFLSHVLITYDTLVRGYTAPEYAIHGQLSEKADTYSYGIVVLEIISGQKSTDVKGDEDGHEYLLQRVSKLL